jgi:hypothetical protein
MENTQISKSSQDGRIKKYNIVKHKLFKDAACVVEHVYDNGIVCLSWINQGFVKSWPLHAGVEFIRLTSEWLVCNNPDMTCVRTSTWRQYDG